MTIGIKSLAIVACAGAAVVVTGARGLFAADYISHLASASWLGIGIFVGVATSAVSLAIRPHIRSRIALALRMPPGFVTERNAPRELPVVLNRALLAALFGCIAIGVFSNRATARIAALPQAVAEPSRSEYCLPTASEAATTTEPAVAAAPPGCALVRRAYELGYAKSLGSCAPQTIKPEPSAPPPRDICTRRQLDEPFLHYAWRRVVDASADAAPVHVVQARFASIENRLNLLPQLFADVGNAIAGSPHAAHHVWITLPDPHPRTMIDFFAPQPPCASRFADGELWPSWTAQTPPAQIVEHALGQLLFATRFGTPASCSDFVIHWGAAPDTCEAIARDPDAALASNGALPSIRSVLNRRLRGLQLGKLSAKPSALPPANAIASVSCFAVGGKGHDMATAIHLRDGDTIGLRGVVIEQISGEGEGPLAVYSALAGLFAGDSIGAAAPAPSAAVLGATDYPLSELEPLLTVSPWADNGHALARSDLIAVYPFEHQLHRFIEDFRRRFLAQRGRL